MELIKRKCMQYAHNADCAMLNQSAAVTFMLCVCVCLVYGVNTYNIVVVYGKRAGSALCSIQIRGPHDSNYLFKRIWLWLGHNDRYQCPNGKGKERNKN